jgi:hypothetical protein
MNEILSLFFPFSGVKNKSPPKIGATLTKLVPPYLFPYFLAPKLVPCYLFPHFYRNYKIGAALTKLVPPYIFTYFLKIGAALHIYLFSKKIKYRQNHFYFLVASSENLYGSIGFFSC